MWELLIWESDEFKLKIINYSEQINSIQKISNPIVRWAVLLYLWNHGNIPNDVDIQWLEKISQIKDITVNSFKFILERLNAKLFAQNP